MIYSLNPIQIQQNSL